MGRLFYALFVRLPAAIADGIAALRQVAEPIALVGILLLGTHGATNVLDDVVFGAVDYSDRAIDATAAAVLGWFGERGWLTASNAAAWSDSIALFVDIDRKEVLAVGLALVVELLLDLALVLWCLPPLAPAEPAPSTGAASAQTAHGRLHRLWLGLLRHAPDALRALAVAFAFVLGAVAIGRWAAGQAALLLAAPFLGPNAPGLAPACGVVAAGLALFAVLPVGVRRAVARARAMTLHRPARALILPLIAAAVLGAAVASGGPGQAVRALWAEEVAAEPEPSTQATTQPATQSSTQPKSMPATLPAHGVPGTSLTRDDPGKSLTRDGGAGDRR